MPLTEYDIATGDAIAAPAPAPTDSYLVLDLDVIVPSTTNPRTIFNQPRLQELADNIKASGVMQPIVVRPLPASRLQETFADRRRGAPLPTYEIVAGERRYRASKMAERTTIPAMVRHLTDAQVLELQLVENLQRDDLHPMEEAEGYEKLCQATGISKEEIGDKVNKSRGTIYARIKLLNLCQEARTAFYEDKIDASRALVIARIPDAGLQMKALAEATRTDFHGGRAMSFKAFTRWAQQNVMLRLDAARFKITDATLVPEAGSCRDCPKRTGAEPEIFADVDSADVCIDPQCYHAKEAAAEAVVMAQAKAKGQKIITEREAKKLWQWEGGQIDGYVRADRPDPRVGGSKMLKTVLGDNCPEPVLMQNPHKDGELIEVLPADKVSKILKETGRITPHQARSDRVVRASEAARNALAKYEKTWRKRAITAVHDVMKTSVHGSEISEGVCRLIASELLDGLRADERQHVCELLGLGKIADRAAIEDYLREAQVVQAEQAMYLLLMQHDMLELVSYSTGKAVDARRIEAVAADYSVTLGDIQAAVKDELKPAPKATAKASEAEEGSAEPAKAKGAKKSSAPPAAQALRGKKKPTTSEGQAREGIAAAMQAAEEGKDQAPDGAELDEGAAPAAPAGSTAAPQVGDRVQVDRPGDPLHLQEGTVLGMPARKGRVRVQLEGDVPRVEQVPAAWLKVLATSLWPFPSSTTTGAGTAPVALGKIVRVKQATLAGIGAGYVGKKGVVKGEVLNTDRWQVDFTGHSKVGRFPKIAEFYAEQLEVLP